MDPVLKAGLPKLFALATLQTTATHTVTECREGGGKKIEHFMEKSTDKKSKLSQGKRANITELRVKKKTLTQQSEEIRKNGGRNGRRRGRKHREAMLGFIL